MTRKALSEAEISLKNHQIPLLTGLLVTNIEEDSLLWLSPCVFECRVIAQSKFSARYRFCYHSVMLQAGSTGTSGQVHVPPSFALLGCASGTNSQRKLHGAAASGVRQKVMKGMLSTQSMCCAGGDEGCSAWRQTVQYCSPTCCLICTFCLERVRACSLPWAGALTVCSVLSTFIPQGIGSVSWSNRVDCQPAGIALL